MIDIIKCIVPLLLGLMNIILFRHSENRRGKGAIALSLTGQTIVLCAINLFFASNLVFASACLVINTIIVFVVYRQKFWRSVALSVYETVSLTISFMCAEWFTQEIGEKVSNEFGFLVQSCAGIVIYLVINICSHFALRDLLVLRKDDASPVFFLFPVCVSVLNAFLFVLGGMVSLSEGTKITVFMTTIFSLVCVLVSFVVVERNSKKQEEITALTAELAKQNLNRQWCGVVESQNELLRRLIHDEKNHLAVIAGLSDEKAVTDYIKTLETDINESYFKISTNNKLLDILLGKYLHCCQTEGIALDTNIKTANLSYISDSDLTSIVANILDNAVEAASESEDKKIYFEINRRGAFDVLICSNSCDRIYPSDITSPIPSSKANKSAHGNGMNIIKSIAQKYCGDVSWSYDKKLSRFVTSIVFSMA